MWNIGVERYFERRNCRTVAENNSDMPMDFDSPLPNKPYESWWWVSMALVKQQLSVNWLISSQKAGKKVYLGAADTFRAAAVDQLVIWGERTGVPVIKQNGI